jgi:predicted Zn-dependent peptidase
LIKNHVVTDSLKHLKIFDSQWQGWSLGNGLRCLHIPLPDKDPRYQVTLLVGTGSRDEPLAFSGVSHLLEHMMFRGSSKHPTFSELSVAFESLGGEWNAATGHEYTEFFYNGPAGHVEESMALFSDFILKPTLNDLETERRIVQRELEGELNEQGVSTDPDYHIANRIWPDTSMAQPIIGTMDSLNAIKIENIKGWLKDHYAPKNSVLCIVGGHPPEIKKLVEKNFGSWTSSSKANTRPPLKTSYTGPQIFWVENSDNEFQVQLTYLCEGTGSPKTPVYELLTRVLADGFSSRLTKRIREELGLVYDISANLHQYYGQGLVNITASVTEENLQNFFKEVFAVLKTLTEKDVPLEELERHKLRAITDLQLTTSEPAALAWRGAWGRLSETEYRLSVLAEQVNAITASQLKITAAEVFKPQNLCVTGLGPKDLTKEISPFRQ